MPYRRISDNQIVADSEALDASGALRSGYAANMSSWLQSGDYMSFDVTMADTGKTVRARSFCDAGGVSLSDTESAAIVARAEMVHRTRTAYLGDSAPAFTAEQAASAVRQASAERSRMNDSAASLATGAEAARVEAGAARAEMINRVSNAWKN